jgi:hypothetical protein
MPNASRSCDRVVVTDFARRIPLLVVAALALGAAAPARAEPSAPLQDPRVTPDAPAYPPPPPRYPGEPPLDYPFPTSASGPAPTGAFPAAPPSGVYRPFSFTAAVGPGALLGPGESSLAVSYQLFRLGLGVARNFSLLFAFEGAGTNSVNPGTHRPSWLKQDIWQLGVQSHLLQRLYVRGGLGVGFVSEKVGGRTFDGGRGVALCAGVGYELVQLWFAAVALDLHGSTTRYERESWQTAGLDLAVSFF